MKENLKLVEKNSVIDIPSQEVLDQVCNIAGIERKNLLRIGKYIAQCLRLAYSDVYHDRISLGEKSIYIQRGHKIISAWDFIAANTKPKRDLSGLGYDQFWRNYKRGLLPEDEKEPVTVLPEAKPVMIPVDEVQNHINSLVKSESSHEELILLGNMWQYFESQREFYAPQPQILLDHTNTLTAQIEALERENKDLKHDLAVFRDLAVNQ